MLKDFETILSGANSTYLLQLLEQYQSNPNSIDSDWVPILEDLIKTYPFIEQRPSWGQTFELEETDSKSPKKDQKQNVSQKELIDSARALFLIRSYRVRGHLLANLDPLKLSTSPLHPDLDPKTYGFKESDYHHPIFINGVFDKEYMTLSELILELQKTYCGNLTVEYMHIQELKEREWFQNRLEKETSPFSHNQKKWLLEQLTKAEFFEKTIHVKFPGAKRFGLDGGESLIPALLHLINLKAKVQVEEIVFGMSHRGRLSVLTNVLNKPIRSIFAQFEGVAPLPSDILASSDVKYHLGHSSDIIIEDQKIHLSLLANPSHLEAVNPLVLGKVRAKQQLFKDETRKKVMGVILHGDAAFAGQGIVAESLGLSGLEGYETGGTIHVIINNQIGFTTLPPHSRSCPYSSDVAKFIQAPIFHVNGDSPESVLNAIQLATDYHSTFGHDVIIDLVCYRRFGHNEGDEPLFTQPKMYSTIQTHPTVRAQYEALLEQKGVLTKDETQTIRDNVTLALTAEFDAAQKIKLDNKSADPKADWMEGCWSKLKSESKSEILLEPIKTGVDVAILRALGLKSLTPPKDFNLNTKIARQWEQKRDALNKGQGIDWALAESLAFGASLVEGHNVRLSGQDCERGTFSQRHAIVVDQTTEVKYASLNHLQSGQAEFNVHNSSLSEFGVLGFEYGFSLANPNNMVLWEAQFGDFANGAQVIIDQFISSAEMKWLRLSGLIMLLPHGFEGQGPEHSSARLERYLQLCAENNMFVANCSTPANYFHILRRQVKAPYRKPLILMTPKSLLRHSLCVSTLKEMGSNTSFMPVISDDLPVDKVQKIVLCSGKVYYDLFEKRQKENKNDVAIIRLEQFYPFPEDALLTILKQYNKVPVIWCQEEPENMGAWHFLDRRLEKVLTKWSGELMRPLYVGRAEGASPAVGLLSRHKQEQEELVKNAIF